MAIVNLINVETFDGMSLREIGERLFELSPHRDGLDISMTMIETEREGFAQHDINVGRVIGELVRAAAVRAGHDPLRINYLFTGDVFTTFSS